eukprot:GDKH01002850.1.p1 GENE.GDKH01002850.1~~GDKH01002850.1.p1  ORF type:complete len:302 (+),score=41.18 GDKH01002850.1:107-1012(+)
MLRPTVERMSLALQRLSGIWLAGEGQGIEGYKSLMFYVKPLTGTTLLRNPDVWIPLVFGLFLGLAVSLVLNCIRDREQRPSHKAREASLRFFEAALHFYFLLCGFSMIAQVFAVPYTTLWWVGTQGQAASSAAACISLGFAAITSYAHSRHKMTLQYLQNEAPPRTTFVSHPMSWATLSFLAAAGVVTFAFFKHLIWLNAAVVCFGASFCVYCLLSFYLVVPCCAPARHVTALRVFAALGVVGGVVVYTVIAVFVAKSLFVVAVGVACTTFFCAWLAATEVEATPARVMNGGQEGVGLRLA